MNYKKPWNNRGLGRDDRVIDPLGTNSEIGRKLKQYYDELLTPEIPERFSKLLQELEQLEKRETVNEE